MTRALLGLLAAVLAVGCTTGEGTGFIRSDRLTATNCWDGPFDLGPTFFASDPSMDSQQIRVQRGDRIVDISDGVLFIVNDVDKIRMSQLDTPIPLGLPIGVTPPGQPRRVEANPPQVSLSLYLNDSCHNQDPAVYSVGGTITFHSLFSGNRNENRADQRLTDAEFDALVTDPRDATLVPAGTSTDAGAEAGPILDYGDSGVVVRYSPSRLQGQFRFFFQRGLPAQDFP
ncbi:MAG TPA: hypothetical protein VH062_26475 [Polyangiaceae bacterium]|jgi:hypothetical protein|nr:hypothetical protein [Polyangiaceae bacterium]